MCIRDRLINGIEQQLKMDVDIEIGRRRLIHIAVARFHARFNNHTNTENAQCRDSIQSAVAAGATPNELLIHDELETWNDYIVRFPFLSERPGMAPRPVLFIDLLQPEGRSH